MERLFILGCGSALPASGRNPTAQVLEHAGKFFLIDCGEGTQSRLRESKLSFDKITHIFISHLHGDHYLGLPGLISTMQLLGRERALVLYGPKALWDILQLQFNASNTRISFPFRFVEVDAEKELLDTSNIHVSSIKLNHRISCFGFIFKEKPKQRRINGLLVKQVEVPHYFMNNLREGEDYVSSSGVLYKNAYLTLPPRKSHSYAFCSDNRIKANFSDKLKGVSILYHESTFLHKELPRAKKTFHTTVKEAAELAVQVKPDLLILGHYSARYKELNELKTEASAIFDAVLMGEDKLVVDFEKIDG